MRKAARVTSIDALKDFKRVLAEFTVLATTSLSEAQAHVRRMTTWVEHEQPSYWKNERRKRAARLAEAKSELFRAQVEAADQHVSATIERRAVERAEAAVEEAETKLANTKRWKRLLEREAILYRGECQRLARALEAECPQALSRLDKMIDALERYVKLPAPTIDPEAGVRAAPEQDEASGQGQATVGGDA
ncbi:MAG: hypothetical protein ACYS1E_09845 [Planctomycetota bacterium]|jgi:DNA repair exonuclease SbcCD ATPase subunit